MSIVIITQGKDVSEWISALKEQRPDLNVQLHPDVKNKNEIEFVLAWGHPIGSFKEYPNLKVISSMGAGVDHILRDPELPKSVTITKLEDPHLTRDMGIFVVALVLNHLTNLTAYKLNEQQQLWNRTGYLTTDNVTVGVMGVGALGAHVAAQLVKLGFSVNGWSRTSKDISQVQMFTGEKGMEPFLASSDILICLLPLTSETENILNKDTFEKLPENAFVINVARGHHLVDADLIEMIDNGHLSGASLDVFREEPLPAEHPFWNHPKINVTPHTASVTDPASAVLQVLENYDLLQNRKPLKNIVSPELGY
jgi:glyoxylate/hydroxypyruvate reductase